MKFFLMFVVVLVAAEAKSVDPATLAKLKDAQRARAAAKLADGESSQSETQKTALSKAVPTVEEVRSGASHASAKGAELYKSVKGAQRKHVQGAVDAAKETVARDTDLWSGERSAAVKREVGQQVEAVANQEIWSAISRAKQNLVLPMLKLPGADAVASEDGMRNAHFRSPGDYVKDVRGTTAFGKMMQGR